MLSLRLKQRESLIRLRLALACVLAVALVSLGWRFYAGKRRAWAAGDVPVAFWAWRNDAPSEREVERAVKEARASVLFLRARQIHYEDGDLRRVRGLTGRFPRGIELHLVYNSTRALLAEFERVDPNKLADLLAETYAQDARQAAQDGARVAGLQLDIDAPTRLLPHYTRILRALRERLPQGVKLSVTGLPTWMESRALGEMLDAVDFWIPQCYGATIPERLEQVNAISSPQTVARAVARARELNHPFYAGLAAYGYTILYDTHGALVALRGDINPALIARDANYELIERRPFDAQPQTQADGQAIIASEWRYLYRARADGVVDGLVVHAGEMLMLDVPSAESLRAGARAVRAEAGEKLLGICVFRLPGDDDPSTLSGEQVAAALADAAPATSMQLRAAVEHVTTESHATTESKDALDGNHTLRLTATNDGATSALMGDDALVIDVRVPAGSVRAVRLDGFSSVETLCESVETNGASVDAQPRPCGERRANIWRLKAQTWTAGASAQAFLSFNDDPPRQLATRTRVATDDGRVWQHEQQITIGDGDER